MRALLIALAVATAATAVACDGDRPSATPARKAAAAGQMCSEHGVLESVCTKCNPALIPVFKAKGDWCEEHGFPESFCPICNPGAGGRPAAAAALEDTDEPPADRTKIQLAKRDTARIAGIEVATATIASSFRTLRAAARLTYDATKVAAVNARAPGVVRSIAADVGTRVKAGAPLAVIESAAVGADRGKLTTARARLDLAEASLRREEELFKNGISPQKAVLQAKTEVESARAELGAIAGALDVVGGGAGGRYVVSAPILGVVTRRETNAGATVDAEHALFEIVDTSSMWAEIDLPESALADARIGDPVKLTFDALSDRVVESAIDYIAPALDPKTRTARARVRLDNPDGLLRAEMFGEAEITLSKAKPAVTVPRTAIQTARGAKLVFVRLADDRYETRRVTLGSIGGDKVEIKNGVAPGEQVVTTGSFLMMTETLRDSIGAGCCDPAEGKR